MLGRRMKKMSLHRSRRGFRTRKIQRKVKSLNEYFKTSFKDKELYHLSFIEGRKGSVWQVVHDWSLSNANNFSISVKPYPLKDRFNSMCQMYRWVKCNYISVYVNVCAYTYSAPTISEVQLQMSAEKKNRINIGILQVKCN